MARDRLGPLGGACPNCRLLPATVSTARLKTRPLEARLLGQPDSLALEKRRQLAPKLANSPELSLSLSLSSASPGLPGPLVAPVFHLATSLTMDLPIDKQ